MSNFLTTQAKRRSIQHPVLNSVSNDALVEIVEKAMKEAPSAFNSQSSRAVIFIRQRV